MPAHLVLPPPDRSGAMRWIGAAAVVVLLHAGLVYWLSRRAAPPDPFGAAESAVMIELPPMAVAPAPPVEVPPGPAQQEAAPPPPPELEPEPAPAEPEAIPELPTAPKPDAVLVAPAKPVQKPVMKPRVELRPMVEPKPKAEPKPKPEPKKVEKPAERTDARRAAGPSAARTTAPRQSAGSPGQAAGQPGRGAAGSTMSAGAWRGLVSARLNSVKRYPVAAQGASGAASISFSIDRSGRLVSARLLGSSGSPALDQEAVAMARRASPFPPPPAEIGGGVVTLSVPVNFRH